MARCYPRPGRRQPAGAVLGTMSARWTGQRAGIVGLDDRARASLSPLAAATAAPTRPAPAPLGIEQQRRRPVVAGLRHVLELARGQSGKIDLSFKLVANGLKSLDGPVSVRLSRTVRGGQGGRAAEARPRRLASTLVPMKIDAGLVTTGGRSDLGPTTAGTPTCCRQRPSSSTRTCTRRPRSRAKQAPSEVDVVSLGIDPRTWIDERRRSSARRRSAPTMRPTSAPTSTSPSCSSTSTRRSARRAR